MKIKPTDEYYSSGGEFAENVAKQDETPLGDIENRNWLKTEIAQAHPRAYESDVLNRVKLIEI